MTDTLFMEERRRVILDRLNEQGRVSVNDLSESLNVSTVTIRQDLKALEKRGLLLRTHGGAVNQSLKATAPQSELPFDVRRTKNAAEKSVLGHAASTMIQDNFAIALDASTTVCGIIPYLKDFESLTVVTNNLIAVELLLTYPNVEVLVPAGHLRRDSNSIVGKPETLPDINLNIGFVSAWGITQEAGLTEVNKDEMAMKQALLSRCISRVVLLDSSKWGQIAPYTYAHPSDMHRILTTDQTDPEILGYYDSKRYKIDIVSVANL